MSGRRKRLAVAGYTLSNIARPLLGLAGSWPMILVLRSIDRMGKGLRSAPRDALVADATPPYAWLRLWLPSRDGQWRRSCRKSGGGGSAGMVRLEPHGGDSVVGGSGFIAVLLLGVGVKERSRKENPEGVPREEKPATVHAAAQLPDNALLLQHFRLCAGRYYPCPCDAIFWC